MKKNKEIFLFQSLHKSTKRNYLGRMLDKKIYRSEIARKYGKLYWDGSRKFGYGGYHYINNYWTNFAKKLIKKYNLNNTSSILDIGCGKAFLIFEIKKILPNIKVYGIDISKYALGCAPKLVKKNLFNLKAQDNLKKKWKKKQFDLVISMGCLHNLTINEAGSANVVDLSAIQGTTYTSGTGIDLTGDVVTNTSPDQTGSHCPWYL